MAETIKDIVVAMINNGLITGNNESEVNAKIADTIKSIYKALHDCK